MTFLIYIQTLNDDRRVGTVLDDTFATFWIFFIKKGQLWRVTSVLLIGRFEFSMYFIITHERK